MDADSVSVAVSCPQSDSDKEDTGSGEKRDAIFSQSVKTSIKEIEALVLQVSEEMKSLKEVIDRVDLAQRQDNKELQSQWSQLKLIVEPSVDAVYDLVKRKSSVQRDENHALLKQLIEVRKQHGTLKSDVEDCRTKVAGMRKEIG